MHRAPPVQSGSPQPLAPPDRAGPDGNLEGVPILIEDMFGTTVGPDCCPGRREKSRPVSRTRSGRSGERSPAGVRGSPRIRATPIGPANFRGGFSTASLHPSGLRSKRPGFFEECLPRPLLVISSERSESRNLFGTGILDQTRRAPGRLLHVAAPHHDSGRRDRCSVGIASSRPMEVIPSDRVPRQPSRMRWERTRPSSLRAALGAVARAGGHASSTSTLRGA